MPLVVDVVGGGPSGSGLSENEFVVLVGVLFCSAQSALENSPSEAGATAVG